MCPTLVFLVRYWREVALALLILILIGIGAYVRSAFEERDRLKAEKAILAEQLKSAAALQEYNNRVTEAISQIRIRSNVNVSKIESTPAPAFIDARPLPFIAGGVPTAHSLYSSAAAARSDAGAARGGAVAPGEPAGAVLPH